MIQFPPMETFNDGELQDGKKLANFYKYSGITDNEITSAIDRCNKKNIARGRMTDTRPFVERVTIYNN